MGNSDKALSADEAVEQAVSASESQADSSSADQIEDSPQPDKTQPDATAQDGEGTQPGPIPLDRHKDILERERKSRETIQQELEQYRQRLSWAESLDRSHIAQAQQWYDRVRENPIDVYQQLGRELESHPRFGPQLKKPEEFQLPEPALVSQDGQKVYSVDQLQQIRDYDQRTAEARIAAVAQQVESQVQQLQAQFQQRQQYEQLEAASKAVGDRLRSLEGWNDSLEQAVVSDFAKVPREELARDGAYATLLSLYIKHRQPVVKKEAKSQVVDTLEKKAAATTVSPSRSGGTAPSKRPSNVRELEAHLEKLAGGKAKSAA